MTSRRTFRRNVLSAAAVLALSPAAFATDYAFTSGTFAPGVTAPSPLAASDTLNIGAGGYKYLNVAYTSHGTINASDNLYFQGGAVLTSTGVFNWQGDDSFIDGGYNGGFANSGVFRKSAGTGTSTVGISGFTNTGTIDAQTGVINFSSGAIFNAGTHFTGAGQSIVSGGASFNGAFSSQNLSLTGGTYTGGAAVISGLVTLTGGTLAGTWQLAAGQTLAVAAGGYKYLNGGLTNNGTITLTDNLYFQNGNTLTNNGLTDLHGDVSFYDGGYNGAFVNVGTLRKSAGTGTSYVSISGFGNSGTIDVQTGTLNFNTGASFSGGTKFTGLGQAVISAGASFTGAFTTAANLTLTGGTFAGTGATIDGDTTWSGGSLTGDWQVAATRTLTLAGGGYKYLNGSLTNNSVIAAADNLYFQNGNTLTNQGTYDAQGDVSLYDGGYNGNFINNGTFRKSAGTGTTYVSIGGFTNNGRIDAQTGTIAFNTGAVFNDGTQFTGAGQVVVTQGATFNGGFTTAANLSLSGGTFTGSGATVNGDTTWSAGLLQGDWTVAATRTLALSTGGYKYLNGSLVNHGTIAASDDLYFENGNTLTNASLYDVKGDFGLHDGGYNGNFVNNGTFRKSAGGNTSAITIGGFVNTGIVEAQTGTIAFDTGALFKNGSQFSGAGQVVINNGATFVGNFSTANNLTLVAGSFVGGDGTAGSKGTLAGGSMVWSSGSVTGNLATAAGTTLTLGTGGYKYVNGSVATAGHTIATDNLYLQNGNTLTNTGVYEAQGDVGVHDGGYSGHFVNSGTFVKTSGTGSTDVSGVDFSNPGTVDVRIGTIVLPNNFVNTGTLKGVGSLATNLLTNSGHVAPGESPGTLTIAGNFAQTALGSLDIETQNLLSFDKLVVNGSASLAGTLALSCYGACHFAQGDHFTILDANPNALTGMFANVTYNGFNVGPTSPFQVTYDLADGDVVLTATRNVTAAVPEPSTWGLMLAGLAALGGIARRRRARPVPVA